MVGRSRPIRPEETPLGRPDLHVVDARFAAAHEAPLIELPLLVAVGAEPAVIRIMPLVLEAHRDPVAVKRPQLLDEAVLELAGPFALQELDDPRAPLEELRAIAPAAVLGVCERHALGIARVPGVLGHADLLDGGLERKGRKRRA